MGRYLDIARAAIQGRSSTDKTQVEPSCAASNAEALEAELRRIDETYGAIRIESGEFGRIWIVYGERGRKAVEGEIGTVYEARMLLDLSPDEIRLLHNLRTIGGLGGSVEIERHIV